MYPGDEVLAEVGRVTIAGSRLDLQMGELWHHLDRSVSFETTRSKPGREQSRNIRRLTDERLMGDLALEANAALDSADRARTHRNEIVHQDWVLRGREAMRPVSEYLSLAPDEQASYVNDWRREAKSSENWQRVPARSVAVMPAQTLEDLRQVERELAEATDLVTALTFRVASSREAGRPPGYVHPAT